MNGSILVAIALALQSATFGFGFGQPQERPNAAFNFEGIDAFWTLVSVLESDTEPTNEQWDAFFSAPGYSRLSEELGEGYFKTALQAVFMPSRTHLAEEMVADYKERGAFMARYTTLFLNGFQKASQDREWLRGRVQELKTYPYLERAADFALAYLPEGSVTEYPEVNFVVFSDSRGYSPLIMGLTGNDDPPAAELDCYERHGQDRHWPFVLIMAHESFHLYRGKVQEFDMPEIDDPDYPVLWTLDQMENEGIGDLINRKRLYYGDGCLAESESALEMHREQLAQPAIIRVMDQILSELADNPDLANILGPQFRSFVPQSGHPTGFYMANLIEEELGAEVIREVVRNPFAFFYLYDRAARINGSAPGLSPKALAYIEALEEKYKEK